MWGRGRDAECGQVYWVTRSMREPRERRCCGSTSAPQRELSLSFTPLSLHMSVSLLSISSLRRRSTLPDAACRRISMHDRDHYSTFSVGDDSLKRSHTQRQSWGCERLSTSSLRLPPCFFYSESDDAQTPRGPFLPSRISVSFEL